MDPEMPYFLEGEGKGKCKRERKVNMKGGPREENSCPKQV